MNRISRRSADEAAEALLELGRTQPVLHYDVELGLARHHHWLRSEAPVPEWAAATAAKSSLSLLIKTIISALLIGTVGVAVWSARSGPQPSAAGVQPAKPATDVAPVALPSVREEVDPDAWLARTPLPVSDEGLPSEQPARRAVRADAHDRRVTRSPRARKELASARAVSARAEPTAAHAEAADGAAARVDSPVSTSARASEAQARRRETVLEPTSTLRRPQPEPAPRAQAQEPTDLVEMQQVATAEQLLPRSPERALALVRQGEQQFGHGYFQQERAYIAIMALIRLGRIDEARSRAASFAKQFPARPYGARIRSALEAKQAAPPSAASRQSVP